MSVHVNCTEGVSGFEGRAEANKGGRGIGVGGEIGDGNGSGGGNGDVNGDGDKDGAGWERRRERGLK